MGIRIFSWCGFGCGGGIGLIIIQHRIRQQPSQLLNLCNPGGIFILFRCLICLKYYKYEGRYFTVFKTHTKLVFPCKYSSSFRFKLRYLFKYWKMTGRKFRGLWLAATPPPPPPPAWICKQGRRAVRVKSCGCQTVMPRTAAGGGIGFVIQHRARRPTNQLLNLYNPGGIFTYLVKEARAPMKNNNKKLATLPIVNRKLILHFPATDLLCIVCIRNRVFTLMRIRIQILVSKLGLKPVKKW